MYDRSEATRSSVIEGIKNPENRSAWERFYALYAGFLLNVAYRKGIREAQAEEILQGVMVEIWRAAPEFVYDRKKGSFRGWLTVLMRRRVIDCLRKREREVKAVPLDEVQEEAAVEDEGFTRLIEEEWLEAVREEALARLKRKVSVRHFELFHAVAVKGWKVAEVAEIYGISRMGVYQANRRVGRVFDPIARAVAEEFDAPPPGVCGE